MISRAAAEDLSPLAALHVACLPDSLLSSLGLHAVRRYYEYAAGASTEVIFRAREGEGVVAACVLSHAPESLLARFATHAPLRLVAELFREAARTPDLRHRLLLRLKERDSGPHLDVPEIVQIFTSAEYRGRGIGRLLLQACEESLRRRRVPAYMIRTHRDDNEAGIRFYTKEGFTPAGETLSFGERFIIMKKELS